jgi:hypothetical protein
MSTDLKADKDRSDLRYSTARKVGKLLAELSPDDVPIVVGHVALEYGLEVVRKGNGKDAPAP